MMQTAATHQAQVELIRSESHRFKKYLSTLSSEVLDRPSPCERWNVGEVIAHLVWFKETYGGMMEKGGSAATCRLPRDFPRSPPARPIDKSLLMSFTVRLPSTCGGPWTTM